MGFATMTYDGPASAGCVTPIYDAVAVCLATLVLDQHGTRRAVDLRNDDGFAVYYAAERPRLIKIAANLIRRVHIDQASLDAEGALDLAFAQLYARLHGGASTAGDGHEAMSRTLSVLLRHVILDESDRQRALKRGGRGLKARQGTEEPDSETTGKGSQRIDAGLDDVPLSQVPHDEIALGHDELNALLARLEPIDCEILIMRCQNCSDGEIACTLGIAARTVRFRMARIRSAYLAMRPRDS